MTSTYDDIEAVTKLLEEKEKDLELTARIGKELLQQNSKLENTVGSLENELRKANEKIIQLTHEIGKKTDLIQILTNDMDEACLDLDTPPGRMNLELLQKKIASLESQNKSLRSEFQRISDDTDDVEEHEQRLLLDITGQLACANSSMTYLEDELDRQKDENRLQHEQILALTAKLQDTEMKLHKFMTENDEMNSLLQITKDNQGSIAIELAEFKARYYEVEALLREAQEQLRKLRKKQMPVARSAFFSSLGSTNQAPFDSLQNELAMSMHSDYSMDSGISNDNAPQYKRVFETVRCASQSSLSSGDSMASLNYSVGGYVTTSGTSTGPRMASYSGGQGGIMRRSSGSIYSSSSLGYPSLDSTGQSDNESFQTSDSDDGYPGAPQRGVPGAPGSADLEAALRRLTPGEVLARRANLQTGYNAYGGYEGTDTFLPFGCRTPDSLMSTGSSNGYQPWKLPEKLQIVKPIEGSQSLHQWSQLAQPTLGGLLDERPGVKIRGGKELEDIGLEQYGLSDLEEDEEYGQHPGKNFDSSAPTYTLTNSMVMHPDDGTFVSGSNVASRVASVCSSAQNSPPRTPTTLSRRNSCSTFSTTYGLAKMLNERGIKAVTPSAYSTPCGVNSFTPTATPCNSPDGSPCSARSRSPEPYESFSLPQLLLSSMPEFVQQTIGGTKKKTPTATVRQKRARQKETLVNKIERIGISTLVNPGNLSISGGMYSRPSLTSPMAQLTCLLPSQSTENLKGVSTKPPLPPSAKSKPSSAGAPPKLSKPITAMGVPGRPGSDSLSKRLEHLNNRKQRRAQGTGMTRPDLGTVSTKSAQKTEQQTSTLGTLSTLLFGRKGGLF